MNIDSVPLSREAQNPIKAAFRRACKQFAEGVKRWFLPHLLVGTGLFIVLAHATALSLFSTGNSICKVMAMVVVLGGYGVIAFGYSLFTACVFALRLACVQWNDFLEELVGQVQDRAATHVSDLEVGLSKPQAQAVVKGSVREVFAARPTPSKGVARLLVFLTTGITAAVLRAVLSSKIAKWSGRTVQLGKLFAGKATLAGAVLLNLHFFATVLLVLCYAAGALVVVLHFYFVFLLK